MKKFSKITKAILIVVFVAYLLCLFYLVFGSDYYGRGYFHRNINLIPFKTIIQFRHNITINILGNIAAFIPMGFLLPIIFRKIRKFSNVLIIIFLITLFIEVTQYAMGVGIADIDDVILNTIGGVMGYMILGIGLRRRLCWGLRVLGKKKDPHRRFTNWALVCDKSRWLSSIGLWEFGDPDDCTSLVQFSAIQKFGNDWNGGI